MSWETMAWAKAQRTGGPGPKAVLMALAEYADERHSCFPGQERLAFDTEQSERTVRTHLRALEDQGFVVTENRAGDGSGRQSNRYVLQVPEEGNRQVLPDGGQPATGRGATGNLLPPNTSRTPAVEPSPQRAGPPSPKPASSTSPTGESTSGTVRPEPDEYSEAFKLFWSIYPRRVEKRAAWRKWKATIKRNGRETRNALLAAAEHYAAACVNRDARVIKHPATFLGPDEPWKDWVDGNPDDDPTRSTAGAMSGVPETLRF